MTELPIKVAVRVRPLVGQELLQASNQCVSFVPGKPQLILGKNRGFTFDHVFDLDAKQETIFETCVKPLIDGCFEGYNAAVIAYGQTGTGKTYTVGTSDYDELDDGRVGILPRAIQEIFTSCQKREDHYTFRIAVSFIEIYLEDVRDLLSYQTDVKSLQIREDEKGNTVVTGLIEEPVICYNDVMSCLDIGTATRQTAQTKMNEDSSRSHCIFTIHIDQIPSDESEQTQGTTAATSSKFHFVDLAGSERLHRSFNRGERFRESVSINSGLLALGNVVSVLADAKRKAAHIPYRDSKLTRVLKDSLGGNSRTVIICCISPATTNMDENLTTLKFATRARSVRNQPIVNITTEESQLDRMKQEIKVLKDQLVEIRPDEAIRSEAGNDHSTMDCYVERIVEAQSLLADILTLCHHLPSDICVSLKEWKANVEQLGMAMKILESFNSALASIQQVEHQPTSQYDMVEMLEAEKQTLSSQLASFHSENDKKECELRKGNQCDVLVDVLDDDSSGDDVINEMQYSPISQERIAPRSAPSKRTALAPPGSRKLLQSSPGALTDEKITLRFRAQSQQLLLKLEEQDEVGHDQLSSSDDGDGQSNMNQQQTYRFGQTWTKKSSSARARRREQNKTPSKLPIRKTAKENADTLSKLRKSTEAYHVQLLKSRQQVQDTTRQIRDVGINMRKQQRASVEWSKGKEGLEKAEQFYAKKLRATEKVYQESKVELDRAKVKLENYKHRVEQEERERRKLEADYKQQLGKMNSRLEALKKTAGETKLMASIQKDGSRRTEELQVELKMLREQEELLKLRLENELLQKEKLEMALKENEIQVEELQENEDLKEPTEGIGSDEMRDEREKLDAVAKRIDDEVENILYRQSQLDKLERDMKEREEAVKKREMFLSEKQAIEEKKIRSSQAIEKDLLRVSVCLDNVSQQLEMAKSSMQEATSETEGDKLRKEIKKLEIAKHDLQQKGAAMESQLGTGAVLDIVNERTLIEINEAMEAISAAISYKTDLIEAAQQGLSLEDSSVVKNIETIVSSLGNLPSDEYKQLTRVLIRRVVDLKSEILKVLQEAEGLEMQISDRDRAGKEMERVARSSKMLLERRIQEQELKHRKEVDFLVSQINELRSKSPKEEDARNLEEKIKQLEKDLYYYKRTSRELKQKLRESLRSSKNMGSHVEYDVHAGIKAPLDEKSSEIIVAASGAYTQDDSHAPKGNELHLPPVTTTPTKSRADKGIPKQSISVSRQKLLDRIAAEEHKKLKKIFEDHSNPLNPHSVAKEPARDQDHRKSSSHETVAVPVSQRSLSSSYILQDSIEDGQL